MAEILVDQGELEEAESRFRDALRIWRASGYRQGVAFAVANLGKIASRQGRFDEAVELLGEARRSFDEVGSSSYVLDVDARLAENAVFAGDPAAAIERADAALKRADAMGGMPVIAAILYRVKAYARIQLGDAAAAVEDATTSLRLAREREATFEVALGLEALARAQRGRRPAGRARARPASARRSWRRSGSARRRACRCRPRPSPVSPDTEEPPRHSSRRGGSRSSALLELEVGAVDVPSFNVTVIVRHVPA